MMKPILLSALVALLFNAPCIAEEECTDKPECWPEGSSMRTGLELVARKNHTDAQIDREFGELVNLVKAENPFGDSRLKEALRAQQAAWLSYRSAECELIGSLTGAGGTWPSTYAVRCESNLANERLRRVRSAMRCLQAIPATQRVFDMSRCLQQLAPLANPPQKVRSSGSLTEPPAPVRR